MEKYIQEIKHYCNKHKKVVIAVGIILAIAIILQEKNGFIKI